MIRSDLAQENLVRKIVVRYLNRRCVNIIKYDEISPLKAETKPKIKACTRFAINIQVNLINYNQNERERERENKYVLVKYGHGLHFPMATPLPGAPQPSRMIFKFLTVNFGRKQVTISLHKMDARQSYRVVKTLAVKNLLGNGTEKASGVACRLFPIKAHAFQK